MHTTNIFASGKLKDVLFILVMGSVCILLLLGIKGYTYPKIARYEEFKLKTSILDAVSITYTPDDFEEVFEKSIYKMEKDGMVYYLSPDNFYIFEFEGRGLWGLISGVITLNHDLETIESIKIISQEETPGLGGRITEEDFLAQFKKKKLSPRLNLILRGKASKETEVDAITGASMTSTALIEMINESAADFRKLIRK